MNKDYDLILSFIKELGYVKLVDSNLQVKLIAIYYFGYILVE